MELHGKHLLGFEESRAHEPTFHGVDPRTGERLQPGFAEAHPDEIARAVELAEIAHRQLRDVPAARRADLLDRAATALEELGDALTECAAAETALPTARLTAERGRTAGQLRSFAELVRSGGAVEARIDRAQPDRTPIPKPDVRQMQVGIGPVAVFGASNFPLAFSVAGGDTASAWAAGCPVVVKAHPHHPGTSEMVGRALQAAVRELELPEGMVSVLHGATHDVGLALVRHAGISAVGFTGSLAGGRALFDAAAARPSPIPVFAEMGSTNPVFLLPRAVAERTGAIAEGLAQSVSLGVGQFCTNPGLVFALDDTETSKLIEDLAVRFSRTEAETTLHAGIARAYEQGVARMRATEGVRVAGAADAGTAGTAAPTLLVTDARTFAANPGLAEETFGPCSLLVVCANGAAMADAAAALGGQLTATVHATEADLRDFAEVARMLEFRAGRIVFNGYPTGVEVCPAMHHGGPYPATTDPRFTSVGTGAIRRFTRPLCLQDAPHDLLPPELADDNPLRIPRLIDGKWNQP